LPDEYVRFSKREGVATITIDRPQQMNAMTTEMWNKFRRIVEDAATDDEVRVVVLTGTGNAFCAGSDVRPGSRPGSPGRATKRPGVKCLEPVGQIASVMYRLGKPTIGAVNGVAAGAGLSLALLCDIRIASEQARFAASWIKVGLIPDLGTTYLLPRTIGLDAALEMILTGDVLDVQQAHRLGLVTRVVPHQDVFRVAQELARKIASGPAIAVELAKRAAQKGLVNTLETTTGL